MVALSQLQIIWGCVLAPTLDELAALSGVSRATVSRVINGGPVAEATRRRVIAVLEQTNYRPNVAARVLASGRSGIVGVVFHLEPRLLFRDPYFSLLLHGVAEVLAQETAGMMLWLGNRTKQETLDRILGLRLLDGVIVTADHLEDPLVDGLMASDFPTVLVGHRREDLTANYVDVDNIQAADVVTTHLINLGRRRIGHITGTRSTVTAEDRLTGYLRAMKRAGLTDEDLIADGDFNRESGRECAEVLVDREVDAIFCANDATAVGAYDAIRAAGRRIPDDIAVAGFDDLDLALDLDPPLTTTRQYIERQGEEAARMLCQILADPEGSPRRSLLPTELVIRQSTTGGALGS